MRCTQCRAESCETYYHGCECACHDRSPEDYRARLSEKMMTEATEPNPNCTVHRRYLAKRRPRANCEACWRMYIRSHP